MSDDPPRLTVASSNNEAEIRKAEAIKALEWPTREMTANLLQVMRGAGRPYLLPQQIIDLASAILEANELSNAWGIWSEMEQWLQAAVPGSADLDDWDDHRPAIVGGSLQVCASRLVSQRAQERMGAREIGEGIQQREHRIERLRAERAEVAARERAKTKPRSLNKKPLTKGVKAKARKIIPEVSPAAVAAAPLESEPRTTAEFMRARAQAMKRGEQ